MKVAAASTEGCQRARDPSAAPLDEGVRE